MVRPGKLSVIGNGVVVDPHALAAEIDRLAGQGVSVTPENLRIADNAPLILSLHRELDKVRESSGSGTRIGTTGRGIGPAYEDKVGRRAIRLIDLAEPEALDGKIERLLAHHNALRRGFGLAAGDGLGRSVTNCSRSRRACCRSWTASGRAARRRAAAPASASCSKARRARCSTSTTAPIRS